MSFETLATEISELKRKRNAVIVAHNYQPEEIQRIADVVGDSFALSKHCAESDAQVIVFCGVHFMAESAKILSPEKTVLLPAAHAGCPMADMVTAQALREKKRQHPEAKVVCYINSSAEVKAESDVCCTSSNAVRIVRALPDREILFVPDQNLGSFVAQQVPEKNIILWKGYCPTHHGVKPEEAIRLKELHPKALLLVHPECQPEVVALADYVGSTKQILDFARESKHAEMIIGTERGIIPQLQEESPNKTFYLLSQGLYCPNMKKTNLELVLAALEEMENPIELDEKTRLKAHGALEQMLKLGSAPCPAC